MSGVADDGAARLDDVLRKHQVGPSAGVARTSSRIRSSSPSHDVEKDNPEQASPSSQARSPISTHQDGTRQVTCVQYRYMTVSILCQTLLHKATLSVCRPANALRIWTVPKSNPLSETRHIAWLEPGSKVCTFVSYLLQISHEDCS